MKTHLCLALIASALLSTACSASETNETARGDDDSPAPAPSIDPGESIEESVPRVPYDIAWSSCTIPNAPPIKDAHAECATIDAPARRDAPNSGTIRVAVYRLPSKVQPSKAQLWLLQGGPGAAGFELSPYGMIVTESLEEPIDVYMVDHRGTGESTYLECSRGAGAATPKEFGTLCSQQVREDFGEKLDGFSTTEAAHDVRELIDSTVEGEQKVFVYGGSYGSYWAHRLLQLPNVRVDGVITDGNCISSTCSFDTPQTMQVDVPMRAVLDACKDDDVCKQHLGSDPWAFAVATMEKLANGHCSEASLSKMAPGNLLHRIGTYWPAAIPPVLFRLDRCSAEDVEALDNLHSLLVTSGEPFQRGPTPKPRDEVRFSEALHAHVVASELVTRPAPTHEMLEAKLPGLTFKPFLDPDLVLGPLYDAWTPYPRDRFVGGWMSRDVPWLMLVGTFDFQTPHPLAEVAAKMIDDPSLQVVRVDGGGHAVVFTSGCADEILHDFFTDPKKKVDTSCLSALRAQATTVKPKVSTQLFGTASPWD